ncbi:MAG: adenylyltransferase/cytidyltransferase family protein [Proteobacteria bacterium]|nr:adenylyltransferase/cytidyltransferase family protein [Pseudomonadota bacterium]MBU1595277.1 adenylyltransferase/cytidyltransferase family protein [Pseudomonadota bacterium]
MHQSSKIVSLTELARIAGELRAGKRLVLAHGCFDLLHIGHIRYLRQARALGDVLMVTISPDRYVDKGPHRPAFDESLRAEAMASLDCVDFVAINEFPTAEETLRLLRPHVYVKGSDFKDAQSDPTGKLQAEERVANEVGAVMTFTQEVVFSSSNLINRFLSTFPEEVQQYLNVFRMRYTEADVVKVLDDMKRLKVLVLGDTILDDYHYGTVIGSSSKEPVLAIKHNSSDLFAGGVLAVANHLSSYVSKVRLFSVMGEMGDREGFIRESLAPGVAPYFAVHKGAPTIEKRRYVEGYTLNKLIEIYHMDDSGLPADDDAAFVHALAREIGDYDVVIAADFGHGTISPTMRRMLEHKAKFLAVNTQANAGNRGFHTISRYERADYVSLAEPEMRLDDRDITGPLSPLMERAAARLNCKALAVTRGKRGCTIFTPGRGFVEVPAFAPKVVDRIGSGDAFFAISALAAALGVPGEIMALLGNAVGGLAVGVIGNKKAIDRMSTQKYLTSLLK